uniref:S49 family peptidase n=1 Tax=Emticicia sp. TaxID=1930953 RepID=UPI003750E12B
ILGKLGAKYADVFGTLAFDKDLGYAEALDGKPEKMQQLLINPHNEMFVNDVLRYRPQINESATHGAVYLSEEAITMGLIDEVGSMQDAITKVFELSKTKSKTQLNSQNNPKSMSNIFKTVVAALGFTVAAKTDNTEPTEEDYANALATGISQKISGFETELQALKDAQPQGITEEALNTKLEGLVSKTAFEELQGKFNAEVEAHKATSASLTELQSKVPGAGATTPPAGADASPSAESWTPIV